MGSKKKGTQMSEDELLEQCMLENMQCYHFSCTKSIKLIRLKCHLCSYHFCTSHIQPEVHGCGGAARREASDPPKPHHNPDKAKLLESKMSRKLQQMKNDRKKKAKWNGIALYSTYALWFGLSWLVQPTINQAGEWVIITKDNSITLLIFGYSIVPRGVVGAALSAHSPFAPVWLVGSCYFL